MLAIFEPRNLDHFLKVCDRLIVSVMTNYLEKGILDKFEINVDSTTLSEIAKFRLIPLYKHVQRLSDI